MRAVLRIWWTFFTAVPLQRWLCAFGCALLLLGVGGAVLMGDQPASPSLMFIGFGGFAIFALFPAVVVTGGALRALSAPLSHQLYPYLRVRLLLAVVMVIATVAAVLLAFLAGYPAAFRSASLASAAVAVLASSTATIFTLFIVTRHLNVAWLIFGFFMAIPFWVKGGGPDWLRAAGFSLTAVVGVLTAIAWVAFAARYFSVARIKPMRLAAVGGALGDAATDVRPPLSRASASRSLLGGKLERPLPLALLAAVGIGVASALAFSLLRLLAESRTPFSFIWPCWAMFGTAPFAERAIRQSRLLWLNTGGGRRETLRLTEGFVARLYLSTATIIVTIAALTPLLWPITLREVVLLATASLSAALCAAYVVLFARGSGLISTAGFVVLLVAQLFFFEAFKPAALPLSVAALTTLQLGAAAALRFAAIRRWRNVDWLQLRPARDQRAI